MRREQVSELTVGQRDIANRTGQTHRATQVGWDLEVEAFDRDTRDILEQQRMGFAAISHRTAPRRTRRRLQDESVQRSTRDGDRLLKQSRPDDGDRTVFGRAPDRILQRRAGRTGAGANRDLSELWSDRRTVAGASL